jgi:hypothetical protein
MPLCHYLILKLLSNTVIVSYTLPVKKIVKKNCRNMGNIIFNQEWRYFLNN